MKRKIAAFAQFLVYCFLFQPAGATIRTVCNYPLNVAQYNDIQSAVDASSSIPNTHDTILVQGSTLLYEGALILNKRLIIIGPGWAPLRSLPALTAKVKYININGTSSSGTEIQGLYFINYVGAAIHTETNVSINDLRIIRNYFKYERLDICNAQTSVGNGTICSGYVIEGNYFESTTLTYYPNNFFNNAIIQNNIFHESYIAAFNFCSNVIINHNLFYRANLNIGYYNCSGLLIQNNIFCKVDPAMNNGTTLCTYKNNITYNIGVSEPWNLNSNTGNGTNIFNQNPSMVDQAAINTGTSDDPLLNFTIPSGPANNSGSDGKDMGLLYDLTGSLNWNNSRNSRLPYIFNINIANNTIGPNATLDVSIEARKNN